MARLTTVKPRITQHAQQGMAVIADCNSWRSGKTTTERGYGSKWQKARRHYLDKHPTCAYCEREGIVSLATVVDHIIPHKGDKKLFWDSSNWQPLCKPHHDVDKKLEELRLS